MEENAGGEGMTPGDGCVVGVGGAERKSFCYFNRMLRYRKVGLICLHVWERPSAQRRCERAALERIIGHQSVVLAQKCL